MDLPDNLLDDLDYIGDCITSCNKVIPHPTTALRLESKLSSELRPTCSDVCVNYTYCFDNTYRVNQKYGYLLLNL